MELTDGEKSAGLHNNGGVPGEKALLVCGLLRTNIGRYRLASVWDNPYLETELEFWEALRHGHATLPASFTDVLQIENVDIVNHYAESLYSLHEKSQRVRAQVLAFIRSTEDNDTLAFWHMIRQFDDEVNPCRSVFPKRYQLV